MASEQVDAAAGAPPHWEGRWQLFYWPTAEL